MPVHLSGSPLQHHMGRDSQRTLKFICRLHFIVNQALGSVLSSFIGVLKYLESKQVNDVQQERVPEYQHEHARVR